MSATFDILESKEAVSAYRPLNPGTLIRWSNFLGTSWEIMSWPRKCQISNDQDWITQFTTRNSPSKHIKAVVVEPFKPRQPSKPSSFIQGPGLAGAAGAAGDLQRAGWLPFRGSTTWTAGHGKEVGEGRGCILIIDDHSVFLYLLLLFFLGCFILFLSIYQFIGVQVWSWILVTSQHSMNIFGDLRPSLIQLEIHIFWLMHFCIKHSHPSCHWPFYLGLQRLM